MAKLFTTEMVDYLREIAPGRFTNELTVMLNDKFGTHFTQAQIKNLKSNRRIRSDVAGMPKEVSDANRITTPAQDAFIQKHQDGLLTKELADLVNREFGTNFTQSQMQSYKARNGLSSGLKTNFRKGQGAWNKGLKQSEFMSAEAIERTKETRFKKGLKPPNWLPLGSERLTPDGYIEIKVRDRQKQKNYQLKHRYVWEKHHGPVPEGHVIMFKDGDRQHVDLDNLMLISRKQLAIFNKQFKHSEHHEINEAVLNLINVELAAKEASKRE